MLYRYTLRFNSKVNCTHTLIKNISRTYGMLKSVYKVTKFKFVTKLYKYGIIYIYFIADNKTMNTSQHER